MKPDFLWKYKRLLQKLLMLVAIVIVFPYWVVAQVEITNTRTIDSLLDKGIDDLDFKNNQSLNIGYSCLEASQKLGYKNGEATAYSLIGRAYRRTGKYDKAIENQIKAYKLYEQTGNYFRVSSVCNNIAIIYILVNDYKKSTEYENYALEALKKVKLLSHNDSLLFVNIYNQLGAANFELKKYDDAHRNFLKAQQISQALADYDGELISMHNIAKVYILKNQYQQALNYAQQANRLIEKYGTPIDVAYSHSLFGWIYGQKGEYEVALGHFKKAYDMADSAGNIELKKEETQHLAEVYEELGDYKKAFFFQKEYMKMSDSLLTAETNGKIVEMEAEYQFEKKQSENEFLKEQNILKEENLKYTRNQRKGLFIGICILIILSSVIVFFLIKGNKRNRQLVNLIEEKNNIMGVLSHDMRSPLVKINNVANASIIDGNANKELLTIKAIAGEGLDMLSNLLDVSYLEDKTPQPRITEIDVLELMQQCHEENLAHATAKQIALKLDVQLDTIIIYSDEVMLKRVVDNLLSNAIKYSFLNSEVEVRVSATNNNSVLFAFIDNGPGIKNEEFEKLFTKYARLSAKPTAGESSTGLGLFISSWLVQLLQGKIWCASREGEGSSFFFEIPVKYQRLV